MPRLREPDELDEVVLICASDIHLSHTPPVARATEPDWYTAMDKPLAQLRAAQVQHDCPVALAGDIFHKWNPPPQLINFALQALPCRCYGVPGQHDLYCHNYEDIQRTAYWTLVEACAIGHLEPGVPKPISDYVTLHGVPWGFLPSLPPQGQGGHQVAIVHDYIWKEGFAFAGAPQEGHYSGHLARLAGYSHAFYGDNHKAFQHFKPGLCRVVNCGAFLRRNSDEAGITPAMYYLHRSGAITRQPLETEGEVLVPSKLEEAMPPAEMEQFIAALGKLGTTGLDYPTAVRQYLKANPLPPPAERILLEALDADG